MLCSDPPRFESGGGLTESTSLRAQAQAQARPWDAAVGSFRKVSPSARLARFSALCFARAVRRTRHTRRPGRAGREGALWGLGMTARRRRWKGGRSVGCPWRRGTSRARLAGCCAVLRGLVAGERCRGRPGRGWGSVGGLVPSQGQCGLPACASGASFLSWYPWMGCLLLAGPKFWVPGAFSAANQRAVNTIFSGEG